MLRRHIWAWWVPRGCPSRALVASIDALAEIGGGLINTGAGVFGDHFHCLAKTR